MLSWTILPLVANFCIIQGSPVVGPQVVNGTSAAQGEFPFMVSLKRQFYHLCGGTIVAPQWVLTAGHCVDDEFPLIVYYGNISLNDGMNTAPQIKTKVNVIQQIVHPNYTDKVVSNKVVIRNDLALLKLEYPLNFSENVQPIRLPKQDEPVPINEMAILTGWGNTESSYLVRNTLQKVNLTIFNYLYCDFYNSAHGFDNTQNICAGNLDNTKGQCNGDSGGPLFIDGVQWGIVSWSIKPCISAPGVFTRTSIYTDWIESVIGV